MLKAKSAILKFHTNTRSQSKKVIIYVYMKKANVRYKVAPCMWKHYQAVSFGPKREDRVLLYFLSILEPYLLNTTCSSESG